VRADRLVSLALLLQARGQMSARALAAELEVSVRTVYRDLAALSAAGVPVVAEPGPGGGCRLIEGYRFPLRGLSPDEAEALLVLGVPTALAELGLGDALSAAHRKISVTTGPGSGGPALVHLDMPRWFHGKEEVPHLRTLAEALRQQRRVRIGYQRSGDAGTTRVVDPFGLVNKAGVWYLVATGASDNAPAGRAAVFRAAVFRAARITGARVLSEPCRRPADFDLAAFWDDWSASFVTSRPKVEVLVRASPRALGAFGEVFGDPGRAALDAAPPADEHGWREVTLTFEHEVAAAHRLAGFGGELEVLSPPTVRSRLVEIARQIINRYQTSHDSDRPGEASLGALGMDKLRKTTRKISLPRPKMKKSPGGTRAAGRRGRWGGGAVGG
jgi:predicted DNA-binding transcriptional regulator YafY